ncbi:MAG: endonuclease/exonuclease/phosphatase family protein [Acidimicrobiia bacterium]
MRRPQGRWHRLPLPAALLMAAAATTALGSRTAPARAAEPVVRFLTYNICGGICNDGTVERPGPDNDLVEHVASLLAGERPHLAVLNEICGAQHARLVQVLEARGVPMRSAFHAQRTDGRCPAHEGVHSFGDAVLSSGPVDRTEVHLSTRPSGRERRSLLCLRTTHHGRPLLACGLHLVARDSGWHARQLDETVRFVRERSPELPVVLAGDFNARPSELGRLSDGAEGGFHTDIDHADDEPTHAGEKIDYVFLPDGHFRGLSGEVRPTRWSDHDMLLGQATLVP